MVEKRYAGVLGLL